MAKKTFEMSFQIGGKLASSFSHTFRSVTSTLTGLKNEARQTQRALDQLSSDFRKGKIYQEQYEASTRQLTSQLRRLEAAQKSIDGFKSAFSQGLSRAKDFAGFAALTTAATATGAAIKSLDVAADFEQQITKVGVIAGATAQEMKMLRDTAIELGAKTSLSASESAVAMAELAAKGMDAQKIVGAMPGIIAAAEASGEDLALTSEVVTSALNAFEIEAKQSTHVADVMAMSANKTAAGVADLGYSFKYAAPVAKQLGYSIEELAAATGIMVDRGLTGEQAGTSLRMALMRLSNPPAKAKKALEKLNITLTDSNGRFKSLAEITEQWNKATKNLSESQKVAYAQTIFGTESATGMLNIFSAGSKKLEELTHSLENSTGAAQKAAKAMKDNYAGALEQLKGAIESAQIKFMTPILPVAKDILDGFSSSIEKNMGGIEKAGQRVARNMEEIFAPFVSDDPKFKNMDLGDKIVYSMDEGTKKFEAWLNGPGGETTNRIFTKLGEIAAKAWWNAFTSSVKASISNIAQGNIFAGLGTGAAAWALGGGVLAKGLVGAWKIGRGISSKRKAATIAAMPPTKGGSNKFEIFGKAKERLSSVKNAKALSNAMSFSAKTLKTFGKAAGPIAAVGTLVSFIRSKDKKRSAGEGLGGLAGGAGGAKLGAAIGSAIAPGIGTAIGSALGGLVGYTGGKFLGGKAVDTARGSSVFAQTSTQSNTQTAQIQSAVSRAAFNIKALGDWAANASTIMATSFTGIQSSSARLTFNLNALVGYSAQASGWLASSFMNIKTNADKVSFNLGALVGYTSQACGWMASFNRIPSAVQGVLSALKRLENQINNIKLPSVDKRVSFDA